MMLYGTDWASLVIKKDRKKGDKEARKRNKTWKETQGHLMASAVFLQSKTVNNMVSNTRPLILTETIKSRKWSRRVYLNKGRTSGYCASRYLLRETSDAQLCLNTGKMGKYILNVTTKETMSIYEGEINRT